MSDIYTSKATTPIGHSARVRTDVDYWSNDKIRTPPDGYIAKHRLPDPEWRCVCAGQGGLVYSSMCPIHDPTVDTENAAWRKWYDDHLAAQAAIKERLGW